MEVTLTLVLSWIARTCNNTLCLLLLQTRLAELRKAMVEERQKREALK